MIGRQDREQQSWELMGPLQEFLPDDHILVRVDRILDLSWLREEVRERYCEENGRPSIDPEAALRLMLAGFFLGIVQDRKRMREAHVNLGNRSGDPSRCPGEDRTGVSGAAVQIRWEA